LQPTAVEDVLAQTLRDMTLLINDSGAIIAHDPLPVVNADALQLQQVFQNLIGNAIKFRGPEPPRIYISARETFEISETSKVYGAKVWEFSVRDNGIGIEPQYTERIFKIFQRLHSRSEYAGTGIGLAMCKRVIERHGGRIWVESVLGAGATFYFTIPANA
jgi:light-regulated signal transduction histidine kinase (bacteriophytochrome)